MCSEYVMDDSDISDIWTSDINISRVTAIYHEWQQYITSDSNISRVHEWPKRTSKYIVGTGVEYTAGKEVDYDVGTEVEYIVGTEDGRNRQSQKIPRSYHVGGLLQERRNSTANALELRLSCTNQSMFIFQYFGEILTAGYWKVTILCCWSTSMRNVFGVPQGYGDSWQWLGHVNVFVCDMRRKS